jgi:hypothetical protein
MSSGAVFSLITNDGKQDRMLMATALLNKRLALIEQARLDDQFVLDPTPTLVDIEKTHMLFVNAHFKPFAAIGFEYNKVNSPSTGTLTGVGQLMFSIQQFGDFFSDMGVYLQLTVPSGFITYTDADPTGVDRENTPSIRWCSYPGERIFKKVSFDVNGNPLDSYTREVYNFFREFCVQPNKDSAYRRLMGQEEALEGYLRQPGVNLTATTDATAGVSNSGIAPSPHRVVLNVANGNQTPKPALSSIELLVPLLFWFNLDSRLAIPSVSIPYGQRFITIDLARQEELCGLVPRGIGTWAAPRATLGQLQITSARLYTNNLFVNPEVHDIFIRRIGFTLIRVHRMHTINVTKDSDEQQLNQFKWPIETMYVGMKETAAETIPSGAASAPRYLDRWHTFSQRTISAYTMEGVLGSEVMPNGTTTIAGINAAGTSTITTVAAHGVNPGDVVMIGGWPHTVLATGLGALTFQIYPALNVATAAGDKYQILDKPNVEAVSSRATFDRVSITAHGIPLYNDFESLFYNSYQPFVFGSHNIRAPRDSGAIMINFCLYPRTYQPSSHINVSRAREFYMRWSSSVISSSNPGSLYALGIAINFLLVSDGSAVLRYST